MLKKPRRVLPQFEHCDKQMFGDLVLTFSTMQSDNLTTRHLFDPLPIFAEPQIQLDKIKCTSVNRDFPNFPRSESEENDFSHESTQTSPATDQPDDDLKKGQNVEELKAMTKEEKTEENSKDENTTRLDRPQKRLMLSEKRRASILLDELLLDINRHIHNTTDYYSTTSVKSFYRFGCEDLYDKDEDELLSLINYLSGQIERAGHVLVRRLKRRDALRQQQEARCDFVTVRLGKLSAQTSSEAMRFSIQPVPGESGFSQWAAAMKLVAQLPGGIPPEFRRTLWLNLAERHLTSKNVDWPRVERTCFSEWSHPEDAELGVQIVKDLHRTGCSLFCGEDGQENQALLKKVLLAYARWNKTVGYCQGFNMLAALILQVTEKSETDALKLMIYLIEGVLPESYFADSLRGLSVDMAVFRELLRTRLPRLARHLDVLQTAAKEGTTSYEPPLTNVFTMQWFLTLFCNCLPQSTVLRVWDLILLEGNEILLRTALAIWQTLSHRILDVRSADEFYCMMGVLTRELLEFNLIDANSLIKAVVAVGSLTELKTLREHYLYNINPWGSLPSTSKTSSSVPDRQLRLYPKEKLSLDISALKKQYTKLRQRQRQAHIIFTTAINGHPSTNAPAAMNHLLLGRSALVPAKRLGPPKGSIPPVRFPPTTLHWKDAPKPTSSSSSSDTELCDEEECSDLEEDKRKIDIQSNEEDNPIQPSSDTDLMITDNINSKLHSATNVNNEKLVVVVNDLVDVPDSDDLVDTSNDCEGLPEFVEESNETFDSLVVDNESDDTDFQTFLEDRIRCLKTLNLPEEDFVKKEDLKLNLARRNSERALQIIQENSVILHRILQCQSRLSPSPPLLETVNSDSEPLESLYFNTGDSVEQTREICYVLSPLKETTHFSFASLRKESSEPNLSEADLEMLRSSQKDSVDLSYLHTGSNRSRFSDILAKSKSLDEKYQDLIVNSKVKSQDMTSNINIDKDELKVIPNIVKNLDKDKNINEKNIDDINIDKEKCINDTRQNSDFFKNDTISVYSFHTVGSSSDIVSSNTTEKSENIDNHLGILQIQNDVKSTSENDSGISSSKSRTYTLDKFNNILDGNSQLLKQITGKKPNTCQDYSALSDDENLASTILEICSKNPEKLSPVSTREHHFGEEPNLKSPNKVFNPFPVSVSSRQNKDIAVKLGLYKK